MSPEAARSLLTPLLERSHATPDTASAGLCRGGWFASDGNGQGVGWRQRGVCRRFRGARPRPRRSGHLRPRALPGSDLSRSGARCAPVSSPAIFPAMTPKLDPAYYQDRVRRLAEQAEAWGVVNLRGLEAQPGESVLRDRPAGAEHRDTAPPASSRLPRSSIRSRAAIGWPSSSTAAARPGCRRASHSRTRRS